MSNIKHNNAEERDEHEASRLEKLGVGSRERGHVDKENLLSSSEQWPDT